MTALSRQRFRIPLGFTLFSLCCVALLLSLGLWQVQRKSEKEIMIQAFLSAEKTPIVSIDRLFEVQSFNAWEYRRVQVSGRFLHDYESRLVGSPRMGLSGYYLVTPLALPTGATLLVNRGWVNKGGDEQKIARPTGDVTLIATLRMSQQPKLFTPPNQYKKHQLSILNTEGFASFFKLWKLLPYYAVIEPLTKNVGPVPEVLGSRRRFSNNHLNYALTWFTLALVVIALYTGVLVQRRKKLFS